MVELIVVYDGISPDHVLSVDSVLGKPSNNKIPIIFYFTKEKSGVGPGAARNLGIKFAKGKYITFVDDDDEIIINYPKLIKLLDSSDAPLIISDFSHTNESFSRKYNESEKINATEFIKRLDLQKKVLNHCTGLLVSKSLFVKNLIYFPEIRLVEDLVFATKMISLEVDILLTNTFRYEYKLQPYSTKNLIDKQTFNCVNKAIYELIDHKKTLSSQYIIEYIDEKILFLKFLAKARSPLVLLSKKNKHSSLLEILYKLWQILFDRKNLGISLKMMWNGLILCISVRNSTLKISKKIDKEKSIIVFYCSGALTKIWKDLFLNLGYKQIYVVDDIFFDDSDVYSLAGLLEFIEKKTVDYYINFIITNLNHETVKKIEKNISELFGFKNLNYKIFFLKNIINSDSKF